MHCGHLQLATTALAKLPATRVLFVPSGTPPHKAADAVTAAAHRVAMLELAVADEPHFAVDLREVRRDGPSYTVTTVAEIREEHPDSRCFFLIGADNARQIGRWYQAEKLLQLCTPVLVPRPGHRATFAPAELPFLSQDQVDELNARTLDMPAIDLSSSGIRRRVHAGAVIADLVPQTVAAYIAEHGLYR